MLVLEKDTEKITQESTMFKSIQKIKGLGVFSDYTKPAGTQDFAIKNLIYGWNYSGKTSLSRLFALIEAKQRNPDLTGCAFTLETTEVVRRI